MTIYLIVALGIELLWTIYYVAKHKAFAFIDIGSDTFFCFYPLQVAVGRQFRELHNLTWSFHLGLGGYLGTLFDPFWFLTAPFPDSWQLSLRLPLFLIKLLLGGGFFYGYLRLIGFREKLAVFGALAYAFSSYGVINAQWDLLHGVELVQFAAYLFLLEKYIRQRSLWAAVCAGIAIGLGHPMGLYMFAVLSVVYLTMRLAITERNDRTAYFRTLAGFGAFFIMGLLVTAPLLLPSLYYFLENPRISGSYSAVHTLLPLIFSVNDRVTIASEIAGLLNKDLLGTGSSYGGYVNYFEAPGFYVGLLLLMSIPQLLGPHATRKERWTCLAGIGATFLYFIWPALADVVYGFGHSGFRFSTLWISALLLILGLLGLKRAVDSGPWRPGVLLGAAGILAIAFGCVAMIPQIANMAQVQRVAGFTLIYVAIYFAMGSVMDRQRMIGPLLVIFAVELMLFSMPAITERPTAEADGTSTVGTYKDASNAAIAFVEKQAGTGAFYRIEKLYQSVFLNDPLVQGYHGTESYTFQPDSAIRFFEGTGLAIRPDAAHYIKPPAINRRDMIDFLGVGYVLARDQQPAAYRDMRFLRTIDGINIYRNESARALGHTYESVVSESAANALPIGERDALLLKSVIVPDAAAVRSALASLNPAVPASAASSSRTRFDVPEDDHIYGEVEIPGARVLLLSVLYDRNWHATLDGADLKLFRADYGLTAALVRAGSHRLEMVYRPPGRRIGWWISAITLAALLVYLFTRRRRFEMLR